MSEKESSSPGSDSPGENGEAGGHGNEETLPDTGTTPALPDVSAPDVSGKLKTCPTCGTEIPPEAPRGLCPKCALAGAAVPTDVDSVGERSRSGPRFEPPEIETLAAAFPQLEIVELIGCGGMGAVYKARQPHLDRFVALKILPPTLAETPGFTERFTREGRLLAKLSHPAIVGVHDFGQAGGFFFLLMEYVDGVNLRQAMRAGRFTPEQALEIVPKVCEALQFAHDEGVLHRDIKPENILLDSKGAVKIADFGIAKLLDEAAESDPTLTGSMAPGTPHYMAPEQIEQPAGVDHRADIYSLGVVFYEMLTGELPIGRFAAPSEKAAVDSQVDEIVFRSLEKERDRRQQSASEVKTEIEGVPTTAAVGERSPERRPNPWVGRLIGLAVVLIGLPFALIGIYLAAARSGVGGVIPGVMELLIVAAIIGFFGFLIYLLVRRPRVPAANNTRAEPAPPLNPWPRRVFWLIVLIFIAPVVLILASLLLPLLARDQRMEQEGYAIRIADAVETEHAVSINLESRRFSDENVNVAVVYEGPAISGADQNNHDLIFPGQGQEWNLFGETRKRNDTVAFAFPDREMTSRASREILRVAKDREQQGRPRPNERRIELFNIPSGKETPYRAWIEMRAGNVVGSGSPPVEELLLGDWQITPEEGGGSLIGITLSFQADRRWASRAKSGATFATSSGIWNLRGGGRLALEIFESTTPSDIGKTENATIESIDEDTLVLRGRIEDEPDELTRYQRVYLPPQPLPAETEPEP